MKLFSNFTLKIMAIIFMSMDHIYTFINGVDNINILFPKRKEGYYGYMLFSF